MPTQTISAMFDNYALATQAVERLKAQGIPDADICLISQHRARTGTTTTARTPEGYRDSDRDGTSDVAENAGTGASAGAALGAGAGLLAGLGVMAIPGIGPVVAAGWLAATALGAVTGGAAGGIIGALVSAGLPESEAHEYAEGVRRGGTLVTVRTDERMALRVADTLDDTGTFSITERSQQWRKEGWDGYLADDAARSTRLGGGPSDGVIGSSASVPSVNDRGGRVRTYRYSSAAPSDVEIDDQRRDQTRSGKRS